MIQVTAESWWAGGETVDLKIGASRRRLFIREGGEGPSLTLLHGYPASSLEWAEMWPTLTAGRRVIAIDFLGFGASDKPADYDYPLDDQAEAVEAVWRHLGVESSELVAYDYGGIVAQVLQARHAAISAITYLNGSLYPELYRPRTIQRLATVPGLGALIWSRFDEAAFFRSWGAVFGSVRPLTREMAREHWVALTRDDPKATASRRLLSYIAQRAARAEELTATLSSVTPTRFLWGSADPVSGQQVADALRERLPGADLTEYPDVGHAPHLEIPDQIAAAILDGPGEGF